MTPDWSKNPQGVPYADFEDPQTLNLYSYVRDNPTSRFDENGHAGDCVTFDCYALNQQEAANSAKQEELAGNSNNQPAQAQNGVTIGSGTFQGQAAVTVSVIVGASAQYDKNGNLVSTTLTTATSYFGTGKNAGQFLGAAETSSTWNGNSSTDVTTSLNFGQATRIMGADRMALGPATAAGDILTHFPGAVANDVRAHPLKYAGIAAEGVLMATPVPEAYEGAKAVVDVGLAAAHLAWDLIH